VRSEKEVRERLREAEAHLEVMETHNAPYENIRSQQSIIYTLKWVLEDQAK